MIHEIKLQQNILANLVSPKRRGNVCSLAVLMFILFAGVARAEVLIVADEFPAMEVVAAKLKADANIDSKLVWQTNLPASLDRFQAVVVYIHQDLLPEPEKAFIDYTEAGGKLVVLHHSISTGKRKNERWFKFLGVALPEGDLAHGGYQWIEPATWSVVNLNPHHFITTNKVVYPEKIPYSSTVVASPGGTLPGFTLTNDEVYLNHVQIGGRTMLLGFKYHNPTNGVTYTQDRAGWLKPAAKGVIVYLMPGHTKGDFETPCYGQIIFNAITFKQ